MKAAVVFFGEDQQSGAYAAALGGGQHGHVLEQQVAGLGDQDDEADRLDIFGRHPGLAAPYCCGIVGGHRSGFAADPGHVCW
jgi:hypothetical protein